MDVGILRWEEPMATSYEIHVDGVQASDLSLAVLRDLADLVVEGSWRAARLAAEGRSTARGAPPPWLAEASDVRLVGLRDGSLALDVRARPLGEVAPELFQGDPTSTAVDLLLNAVDDALQGRRDSEYLDAGVLGTLVRFRGFFARGPVRLRITRANGRVTELSAPAVDIFQALAADTPDTIVDRVVGVIDSLTMSSRTCIVRLIDGTPLKGSIAATVELGTLKPLLGLEAVVEGTLSFRPSGRPLRIEIDQVAAAAEQDVLWRRVPIGTPRHQQLSLPSEGLESYFGQWPGEEDDDQVFAALRAMS
jgi:hypothetical protein